MNGKYELPPVVELRIADIDPDANQPRDEMVRIDELAASIARYGLRHPILVRKVGSRYRLIGGERRWTAAQQLGWDTIPAYVAESDDAEAALLELVDNQHVELTDAQKSRGAQRAFVFDVDIESVAAATGYGVDVVAKARSGYTRVGDPLKTETMSFAHLAAIDEFAGDEKAVDALVNASEATWRINYDNLVRERTRIERVEIAKASIARAGVTLLTTNLMNPDGYAYLGMSGVHPKEIPAGATAAKIEAYGSVQIVWYGDATEDPRAAAEAEARQERDRIKAELAAARQRRLAFIAANFEFSTGLKTLAKKHWEAGESASVRDIKNTPLDVAADFTARVIASLLADLEGDLERILSTVGTGQNDHWLLDNAGDSAATLLAELSRAGYTPDGLEAERVVIFEQRMAELAKQRAEEMKEIRDSLPDGACCRNCAYGAECERDDVRGVDICEEYEAAEIPDDGEPVTCARCANNGEVCAGGDEACDDYVPADAMSDGVDVDLEDE